MALWHIANQRVATLWLGVEYLDIASKRLLQSENQAKESSLPCPIGADNRYELATINVETGLSPDCVIRVASCKVSSCDDFRGYRVQSSVSWRL